VEAWTISICERFRAATAELSVDRRNVAGRRPLSAKKTTSTAPRDAARSEGVIERTGSLQLNFYVAPGGGCKPTRKGSLQYPRLLLACAMTGEFAAAWLPSMLVPLVGILGPAVAMALLFNVIEARD